MSRRSFSDEFKRQAVAQVLEQKRRRAEVCRDLAIGPNLLDRWIAAARQGGSSAPATTVSASPGAPDARIRELEKELERVKMERDILKKAAAYFAKESL
jgi:transposase